MNKQKLKGLWIPTEILLNEELTDKEKLILAMILYLSEETSSCFANNKYIANIVNVTADRLSKKRDEKILEEIIKPKDDVIQNLYKDNLNLHRELSRQTKIIEEAEKYQKERDSIITDNEKLHNQVENIQAEEKESDMEWKYKSKIKSLEKENNHLHKVVDKFYETVEKFID